MYHALLGASGEHDVSSLRLCISGGAALPVEVMRAVRGGVRLHHPRGLRPVRDLAGRVVQPPGRRAQAGLDRHADRGRRDAAVGDDRDRQGEVGEIAIRGHNVMKGYWNRAGRHRRRHAGRLVPHRRHGHGGRGRLLLHRRPQEGHDHPRRLQRVSARDRGGALRAPGRVGGGRDRRARRRARRGGRRRRRAQARAPTRPRTTSAPSSRSASPPTSTRAGSGSPSDLPKGPTGKILKRDIQVPESVAR